MTDSPFDVSAPGVTVTIKYGKGYEESWIVFKGSTSQVFDDICKTFGYVPVGDMTLHDLVVEVTKIAHGARNVASTLGGTVVEAESTAPIAGDIDEHIFDAINAAKNVDELNKVFYANKDRFKANTKLVDASKARKAQF